MKRVCFVLIIIFSSIIILNLISANNINVCSSGCNFASIQAAVNNASDADTINVLAGTFNENQIVINKSLNIVGAGPDLTILNGSGALLGSTGLVRIIAIGDVNFSGFKIINSGGQTNGGDGGDGRTNVAIYAQSSNPNATYLIRNNKIYGTNNPDDAEDYGFYSNSGKEALKFINNTITQTGANAILMELHAGSSDISYNFLDSGAYGVDPIFYMTYGGINISSEQKISFNKIDLGTGTGFDAYHRTTGISFMSSYSGSGPIGEGKYSNIVILNNLIYNLRDNRRGISLYNDGLTDGKNGEISNAIINYNNITCIDSTNNFGIRLAGYVTSTQITNNLVSKCNQSFIGINSRNGNHYPLAPFIHFNSFENESFIWNGARLNATYNFFGNCVDPIQLISGNVTFNPYYGSCIQNTSISKSCLMSYDTVRLFSQISSKLGVCNVKFYIYSSNSINPLIYDGISNLGNYTYDLNLDAYDGQNITWNVSSDDCNGFFNMIRGGSFKVNKRTSLSTNPANPDGLNSWYGSRPIFYLINPEASSLFYRWEAGQTYLYNVPFSLDNSPNDGNNSGGIMRLNYWSNICNESVQNKTFYIDLTAPIVNRLIPDNNQIVYNNKRPVISAYLEEVYFSNSGIDKSSVRMFVNGIEVNRTISTVDVQNAIITHNPSANLNEGRNNISVFVRDNSGKSTNFSWSFFINTSVPMFNMSINSPNNQVYSTRSVKFNIILTSEVEKLEYINFNDNVPRYKSLCLRCNGIGYLKNFNIALNEGDNNISIRAIDRFGNIVQKEISLFIDSKPPIVNLVAPRRNQHTNGSLFFIKYTEDNLMNITFYYGNGILIENITKDCSSGKKQECIFNAELESFNGERIIYWFNITDIARTISTKPVEVFADTNAPQINIVAPKENLTYYSLSKARMALNITLDEKADLAYINYEDIIPKLKKLCSNCNKYYGTQTFNLGVNNITVFARDSAGNSLSKSVSFSIN